MQELVDAGPCSLPSPQGPTNGAGPFLSVWNRHLPSALVAVAGAGAAWCCWASLLDARPILIHPTSIDQHGQLCLLLLVWSGMIIFVSTCRRSLRRLCLDMLWRRATERAWTMIVVLELGNKSEEVWPERGPRTKRLHRWNSRGPKANECRSGRSNLHAFHGLSRKSCLAGTDQRARRAFRGF